MGTIKKNVNWLDNFKVVKGGGTNRMQAICPAHEDENASLTISRGDNKWVFYCHAGCSYDEILKAAGVNSIDVTFDNVTPIKEGIEAVYDYKDEAGKLVFQAVRFRPKGFRQRRPVGDKWVWNLQGVKLIPYNLQAVMAADTVFVVEGEKDVDSMCKAGYTATCNPMGAGKWRPEFSGFLAGKQVYIIPDGDKPGQEHAAKVYKSVKPYAGGVEMLKLPHGKDVTDYLQAGGKIDELLKPAEKKQSDVDLRAIYNPYRDTHLGNAERLIKGAGDEIRYSDHLGWLSWTGKRWEAGDNAVSEIYKNTVIPAVYQEISEAAEIFNAKGVETLAKWAKRSESMSIMRETLAMAATSSNLQVKSGDFDSNPMAFNCLNGTVDLETGELKPHKKSDFLTKLAPVKYDAQAACPRWEQFLEELFPQQPDLINWLQRAVGYCLTGSVAEQSMFFLTGAGRNGKSVFMNTIMALLGEYACETPTETLMMKQGAQSGIANDLARLPSMRLVSANETEQGQRLAEAKIKAMTGGDTITARFLHKEFFDFKPVFKLWLRSNHKPVIRGTDEGIWRRVKLIPFNQNFEGREDKDLQNKLLDELDGIFKWALVGCLAWQKYGLEMPDAVSAATQQYRSSQDVIGLFLEECVKPSIAGLDLQCKTVYEEYCSWCEEAGERALSQRKLNESMQERGYVKKRKNADWKFRWENLELTSGKLKYGN